MGTQKLLKKLKTMARVYILFICLFICSIDTSFASDIEDNSSILKLVDGDHYLGNRQAKVIIIEYSSLSCPGCSSFHEGIFAKIKKNYISNNKILYIFRDYPVNEPALFGAIFANCFNDNYFDIIDILFKSQTKWAFRKDFTGGGLKSSEPPAVSTVLGPSPSRSLALWNAPRE